MLLPNNKQKTKLFQYANTARFAYNWALGRESYDTAIDIFEDNEYKDIEEDEEMPFQ